MLFYEPLFLFFFLPVVFSVFLLLRASVRWSIGFLAVASFGFYAWAEPLFAPLALASAWLDHLLARRVARSDDRRRRGRLVAVGVVANLAILFFFKYWAFALGAASDLFRAFGGLGWAVPAIALPIGVSFIVFEKITYLVDVDRGVTRPAAGFGRYLFYVFFFPKLLAGPIVKYHEVADQIATPAPLDATRVADGFERFATGVVKKVLIADPFATVADSAFAADPTAITAGEAWLGIVCFSLQIYFDFSGYSDMAIGLARMFGLRLRENFDFPYAARSITEFWRRWHISLTSWIREYLYVPLGGNRGSTLRTYGNLWVCFLASGIWHGANWTYLAWGAFHGLFLVLDRLFLLRWLERLPAILATAATVLVVMHGWVLFRAPSIGGAAEYFRAMYAGAGRPWPNFLVTDDVAWTAALATVGAALPRLVPAPVLETLAANPRLRLAFRVLLFACFLAAIFRVVATNFRPFLYFRF